MKRHRSMGGGSPESARQPQTIDGRKSVDFAVKAVSSAGSGSFEGLAAVYCNIDEVGDIIAPGAFTADLPAFLAEGFIGSINHDWDHPIGHPAEATETKDGLYIRAVFDASEDAQDVRSAMTPNPETGRATVRRLSIGYRAECRYLEGVDEVKAWWASVGYTPSDLDMSRALKGARLLTRVKLIEVSPVVQPANTLASVTGVKSLETKRFADHSREVVSALKGATEGLEAFVQRAEGRVNARVKAGRELSNANWTALKNLYDSHMDLMKSHGDMVARLKELLDRTSPESSESSESGETEVMTVNTPKQAPTDGVETAPKFDPEAMYAAVARTLHEIDLALMS